MRTTLLSLLLFALLAACRSDSVGPSNLLLTTWERQPVTSLTSTNQLLTFRADGQVRYGTNQDEAGCCQPTHFTVSGESLSFVDKSGAGKCALVFCAPSLLIVASPWQIETLTATELVIKSPDQRLVFKAR